MTLLGLIVRWEDMSRAIRERPVGGAVGDIRNATASTLSECASDLRSIVGVEREEYVPQNSTTT